MEGKFALEYKYDGIRAQVHKKGNAIRIFSRSLLDITSKLGAFADTLLKDIVADEIILEGEIIGIDKKGKPVPFQKLIKKAFNKESNEDFDLQIFLFDCLFINGTSLENKIYLERIKILNATKGKLSKVKSFSPSTIAEGEKFFKKSLAKGYEGVMAKKNDSVYSLGKRGNAWMKLKNLNSLDLVILKAYWGYGRRHNWLSDYMLYCISRDKKSFFPLGKTFKGLTDKEFSEITTELLNLKINDISGGVEVKPSIVVEVGFEGVQKSEKYQSGYALRFARILRFRRDKTPFDASTIEDVESFRR
jgi:DNA ligase-1